jgi:hypothetical protein
VATPATTGRASGLHVAALRTASNVALTGCASNVPFHRSAIGRREQNRAPPGSG